MTRPPGNINPITPAPENLTARRLHFGMETWVLDDPLSGGSYILSGSPEPDGSSWSCWVAIYDKDGHLIRSTTARLKT